MKTNNDREVRNRRPKRPDDPQTELQQPAAPSLPILRPILEDGEQTVHFASVLARDSVVEVACLAFAGADGKPRYVPTATDDLGAATLHWDILGWPSTDDHRAQIAGVLPAEPRAVVYTDLGGHVDVDVELALCREGDALRLLRVVGRVESSRPLVEGETFHTVLPPFPVRHP